MQELRFIAPMDWGTYDQKGRRKYLSKEEGREFISSAQSRPPNEATFCLIIYFTGCRVSEALGLTLADFDLQSRVVIIRTLKRRTKEVRRRVPIPSHLAESIQILKENDPQSRIWQYSRTTAWRLVKKVMKSAGIEGIQACPKGLRHSFGVRAALQKVPITLIQGWMGHADISTTGIYLDVRDEEERELIRRTW